MRLEDGSRRRPFLSLPEDLFDEDYYDEQPEKKRRLTTEQVHLLEKSFETENKLEPERKTQLAKKLGLQPRQVAVWFQNRRARWKTKQLEMDYDLLKSSYDSLRANYDSVFQENEKLRTEVVSLSEKLEGKVVPNGPASAEDSESLGWNMPGQASAVQFSTKLEDRVSSGSGGSAVVDEEGPQLVDSGDSYFPNEHYGADQFEVPVDRIQSEDDDGSVDGRGYFADVFVDPAEPEEVNHGDVLAWWVWS